MFVSDRCRLGQRSLTEVVSELARAGVDWVQIREKDLEGRALLELARAIVASVRGTRTRITVNSRPDIAEAAGADGVQLPEEGLPVAAVRRGFPTLVVGASCHSVEGVQRAEKEGAHFAVLGPVFMTPGKESRALGVEELRRACQAVKMPVMAIGGIDPRTASLAWACGARGVAAIRLFLRADGASLLDALRRDQPKP